MNYLEEAIHPILWQIFPYNIERKPIRQTTFLSRYDGQLFPGNTNRFSFSLVDGNGLHSLDSIQFGLTNDDDKCVIEYRPWNGEIIHDVGCLIKPPRVYTSQIPST